VTPEEKPQSDRRRSARLPLQAIVHYHMGGSEFINLSSNLSAEGIFIRNFSPPPVGTELRIKVRLPDELGGVPVQLVGKVVRVADDVGAEERGMGVEFTSVQAGNQEAIRYFVDQVYGQEQAEDGVRQSLDGKGFHYTPGPSDVLTLQPNAQHPAPGRGHEPRLTINQKLIWAALLLLVGVLFGGGLVFLAFLAR
jgi:uncharacterized protein (TIGR02266 family)